MTLFLSFPFLSFFISDHAPFFFSQAKKCKGIINLERAQIFDKSKPGKPFRFKIAADPKVFYVAAETKEEFEDWSDAFEFIGGVTVSQAKKPGPDYDVSDQMGTGFRLRGGKKASSFFLNNNRPTMSTRRRLKAPAFWRAT